MTREANPALLKSMALLCFAGLSLVGACSFTWAANPVKLGIPLGGTYGSVREFQISPDGTEVLINQAQAADSFFRTLVTTPISGGSITDLTPTDFEMGPAGSPGRPRAVYTPDGEQVVFLGLFEPFSAYNDLHVVPSDGGTIRQIHEDTLEGENARIREFYISPDSQRVVFLHDRDNTFSNFDAFSSTLNTVTPSVKLNPGLNTATITLGSVQIDSTSSRVLFHQSTAGAVSPQVFTNAIGGGSVANIDGTNSPAQSVSSEGLTFNPAGTRVLYHTDRATMGVFEIFTSPSEGGIPNKRSGTMVSGGNATTTGLQYSPDGNRIVYQADQTIDGVFEVFSVPASGGTVAKLNQPLTAGRNVSPISFSPDSSRVLYFGDQTTDDVFEIYTVSASGGSNNKINGTLVAGGDVYDAEYSPNSSRVVYLADGTTDEVLELYSTSATAAAAVKLNHGLAAGEIVSGWTVTPDSNRVLYTSAFVSDPGVRNLFITPMLGGTPVLVNLPLADGQGVNSYRVSPDGRRVIYMATVGANIHTELFSQALNLNWTTIGGSWNTAAGWDLGVVPDEITEVTIGLPSVVTVPYSTLPRAANKITLGGGAGDSVLELQNGAAITTYNGLHLLDNAVLRGDGLINIGESSLTTSPGSEIRVAAGERLRLMGTQAVSHALPGKVEVIGTPENPAELEFDFAVENSSSSLITGRNAILRFNNGILNEASMAFSFGTSDLFGDIDNQGNLVVSGGAGATFHDDVNNDGTVRVSRTGLTTSVAVFFGAFTGGGGTTGGGDIFFEGDLRPGNSPAIVTMENNVFLGSSASLEIELGGELLGNEYDQLNVTGALELAGELDVMLINGFTPTVGDSFDILNWTALGGTFDTINLPDLGALTWNISQLYTTGTISVGLAGDFDFDGDVDGRDFLIWQRGDSPDPLSTGDLSDWQTNYGVGALTAASTAVPEPGGLLMLGLGVCVACWRRVVSH